jgi:hypothetical protein
MIHVWVLVVLLMRHGNVSAYLLAIRVTPEMLVRQFSCIYLGDWVATGELDILSSCPVFNACVDRTKVI